MWQPYHRVARTVRIGRNWLVVAEHLGQHVRVAVQECIAISQRIGIRWHRRGRCWRLGFRVAVNQRARIGHSYRR